MNKLSKLTALLLAIVLALSVPLGALAESAEIETKTEFYEVADKILQAMIMAYKTYGEYKSMAEIIANEDFAAFLDGLPEEELKELANYVNDMFWAACIPYTNVGPFLPAVDVTNQLETASTFSLISRAATDEETVEGLYLDKKATGPDDNGQYSITLEAYVTGQVTTSTVDTFTPVDVVLVLDTSGSMAYDVSSDDTRVDYEDSRRYALQQGVNTFIDQVAEQSINANHRISIVEYDRTNHSVLADWSFVDTPARVDALKDAVDTLDAEGGTRPGMGLDHAYDQLTDDYNAPQGSTERKKIVVLFTDGIPSRTSFQPDFAAEAIETAYLLKANPDTVTGGVGATLYSIAIFPGADPATPVSTWTDIYTGTDDIAICNAFLHAVSSNYPSARASEGTVTVGPWYNQREYDCVDITPGTGRNNGYYLTANSVESMREIFTKISDNIQSSHTTSTLTETTVVKDVLSPYFELPTGFSASSVTVQTADYKGTKDANGNLEWDDPVTFNTGEDGISFGTDPDTKLDYVNVKNFGFNDNYVADVDHVDPFITNDKVGDSNVFYGRKFIISFKVEPTDGFLGGNNVVTNDGSSGIYQPSTDGTTLEPVKPFPKPNVDVQIVELEIVSNDQHIYLGNAADLDALLKSFSTQYWILENNGKDGIYTVNTVNNEYATIKFTLTTQGSDGKDVQVVYTIPYDSDVGTWTYFIGSSQVAADAIDLNPILTADKVYEVNYEVIPRPRTDPKDTRPSVAGKTGTLYPIVHVHTPTLTFQDSVEDYATPVEKVDGYYATKNFLANDTTWAPHTCTNKYTDKNGVENTATATYNPDGTYTKTCVAGSETTVTTVTHNATDATLFDKLVTVNGVTDPDESKSAGAYGYTFIGTEPTPQITYTPTAAWQTANGTGAWQDSVGEVTATTDVPIVVKVMLNTVDATNMAKLIRNTVAECKSVDTCTWTSGTESQNAPAFVIHITNVMGSLTISKTVEGTGASVDDTFLFTITGPGITGKMQVILKGGQSVTINNLLVGDYVVKEETGWSWRYTCEAPDATLEAKVEGNKTAAVEFTNTLTTQTWLDGNAHADNNFAGSTTTEGGGK